MAHDWTVTELLAPDAQLATAIAVLHNLILPAVFYLTLFVHLGAMTRHHFGERRVQDIRRLLR